MDFLWAFFREQYVRTGDIASLDQAVGYGEWCVAHTPPRHPMRGRYLTNLGLTLQDRFDATGSRSDLETAVRTFRDALAITPIGHFRRAWSLSHLAVAVGKLGGLRDSKADIDEAVRLARAAVSVVHVDDPDRATILSNLAGILRIKGERAGSATDLADAVQVLQVALSVVPAGHHDHGMIRSNLSAARRVLGEAYVSLPELEQAADHVEPVPETGLVAAVESLAAAVAASDDPDLFDGVIARMTSFARGDVSAVTEPAALVIAARLWSASDRNGTAAHAAGLLAWSRFLVEDDPFHTEDLGLALSMLGSVPAEALPELIRQILAVEVPADLEPAAAGAPCHPIQLVEASEQLRERLAGDLSDADLTGLARTIRLTRLAVELTKPDGRLIAPVLDAHADAVMRLSGATDDPELLKEVVSLRRLCVEKARPGEENTREFVWELGIALALLYAHEHDLSVLTEAEEALRRSGAVPATESSGGKTDAERAEELSTLFQVYILDATAQQALEHKHIAWHRGRLLLDELAGGDSPEVVMAPPYSETDPSDVMGVDLDALEIERIERKLQGVTPADIGGRAVLLAELADAYRVRFNHRGVRSFLEQALALSDEAVELCPEDHPGRRACAWTRAICLDAQIHTDGDQTDVGPIIDCLRETLALASDSDRSMRAYELNALANYLIARFRHSQDWRDIDEADDSIGQAAALAPAGSATGLVSHGLRGAALLARVGAGDYAVDVDAAIDSLRTGAGLPESHENFPVIVSNLAKALVARYVADGSEGDLDEAVERASAAVAAVRKHRRWLAGGIAHDALMAALLYRYRVTGASADLEAAIASARTRAESLASEHPLFLQSLADLAEVLAERAGRNRSEPDLAEAVRLARTAAADPKHGWTLATVLATALNVPEDWSRLTEAAALARDLFAEDPDQAHRIILARMLQAQFLQGASAATPDFALSREAERLYRDALPTERARAQIHLALGSVLYERAKLNGDIDLLGESCQLFSSAALDQAAPPFDRVRAAQLWGAAHAERAEWKDAADAFGLAVELLPQLAPRSLVRADREYWLGRVEDLASNASVAALRGGDAERAVRLFESGRAILWAQLLETRGDLAALADAAPELATRFESLRDDLDAPQVLGRDWWMPFAWESRYTDNPGGLAERERKLGESLSDLIAAIRALDGFEDFARPSRPPSPLHPGVPGPVVLLATSDYGSQALVLKPDDGIEHVPLPRLTPDAVRAHGEQLSQALTVLQDRDSAFDVQLQAENQIRTVLDWLGNAVTDPVLEMLDGGASRIWWIPGGPLASLPVHAAGQALERVCSSYAVDLQTLRSAVAGARPPQDNRRLLVVAMPQTPGEAPLPGAGKEAQWLSERFASTALIGPDATRAAVLASLPECEIAHFACHTSAGDDHRLLLHDHKTAPLTFLDLTRHHFPHAGLAYLSACTTVLSRRGLADEAIHLAAALQHAGFPQVVGTLWPIADAAAVRMATAFYEGLHDLDVCLAPESLHAAARSLALEHPGNPSLWACHIHFGI